MTTGVELTSAALAKVQELINKENDNNLFLRLAVQPGGCSGLRYSLYFDIHNIDGDVEKTYKSDKFSDVKVKVDKMSQPYLDGAIIDFVDTIEKQGFTIDNPNAGGACACGDSFH